ncbi:hypothetical protein BSIN_1880 [Burkholderia singularis]|uniref:Uncharacterized protein n=1 Tax=Burkholderia singularis TaxID=1503053 RepID=A0A238H058_9BURK|nr:hypothetical protein BSIN_1880 [Burkholderia singularis]
MFWMILLDISHEATEEQHHVRHWAEFINGVATMKTYHSHFIYLFPK